MRVRTYEKRVTGMQPLGLETIAKNCSVSVNVDVIAGIIIAGETEGPPSAPPPPPPPRPLKNRSE